MKKKAFHGAVSTVAVRIERAGYFLGRHPVPALLGGILLGWLTLRRRHRRKFESEAIRIAPWY